MPTQFTEAQKQGYIDQALRLGIPQSAIDYFLSGNNNDYPRIVSALGPEYVQAAGSQAVATITPASSPSYASLNYAAPTPLVGGAIFAGAGASDATLVGQVTGAGASPQTITIRDRSGAAPALTTQVLPAPGIPTWAIVAAFAVLALLFLRK